MSIITYPLNGVTYGAEDVSTYLCTRTSGIYAKESNFTIRITGTREITVSPGLAWINYDDFCGVSVCSREDTVLTVPAADSTLPRIDRVVLQFDADANATVLKLKPGTPAAAPEPPAILQNHRQYELGLCTVSVPGGSATITAADITDTRLDEELCGIMRDGVTGIPTEELLAEAKARLATLEETASTSAAKAAQSEKAAAESQTAAAGSASTASTKASEAATSASNAASSANAANTSQAAAASSASTASAKAAAAAESANAAANSAEAASNSAKEAEASAQKAGAMVSTDPTLSIEGAPADAKATGDALGGKLESTSNGYVKALDISGNTLTITYGDGTTNSVQLAESYTLPAATASSLGGVKVGAELDIAADGTISAESLAAKLEAVAASNYEPRLVWTTDVSGAKRKTTFTVSVPDGIDYVYVKPIVEMSNSDTSLTTISIEVVRGQSKNYIGTKDTVYDNKHVMINMTFAEDGVLTIVDKGGYYSLNKYEVEGYHYITYADILEQIETVSAEVTAMQTALEDADALNVDQEYRLTLLELGIDG